MSPSHTAADPHADPADLHGLDILVSLVVHALVIGTIVVLALWEVHHTPKPLQRIQVSMITPGELNRMIRHAARPKPHAARHAKTRPRPSHLPSRTPSLVKPARKPAKPEKPFDPFAPLESKQDVHRAPARHAGNSSNNSTLANMQMQQLSQQEINRYVAMIQSAVEQHWKVPVNLGKVKNPLVELRLNPDGSVLSIKILESSGNAALDDSLGRAIMAAAPFQLPRKQFEAFRDNRIRFVPIVNQQQ